MQVGNLSVEVFRVGESGLKLRVAGHTYGVETNVGMGELLALARYLMPEPEKKSDVDLNLVEEVLSAGVRALARKRHPDAGGSNERMAAVNAAVDWIREKVRG